MHIRKLLSLFAAILATGSLWSQDIHFSQYNMAPMSLNPALIGKFEGTVRIGGIFRGQWASVLGSGQQFRTPSAWIDAPIIRGFRKNDWVGVGLMIFTDKAGILGMTHNGGKLGAAYHLALDKKRNAVLSLGGHYGGEQRKLDPKDSEAIRFGDGFKPDGTYPTGSGSISMEQLATDATKYKDIDGGISLSAKLNKTTDFNIGYSMYHLGRPNYSLAKTVSGGTAGGKGNSKLPFRSVLSGQFNAKINDRFTASPSFFYQTMSGADEIALQAMAGYLFDPAKDLTVSFGLGYRLRDAIEILIGFQQKNLRVGFAYDVNVSGLSTATKHRGGFEIAANYIIKKYKPAILKPKILCPRF